MERVLHNYVTRGFFHACNFFPTVLMFQYLPLYFCMNILGVNVLDRPTVGVWGFFLNFLNFILKINLSETS